jgi:hypothetical protein
MTEIRAARINSLPGLNSEDGFAESGLQASPSALVSAKGRVIVPPSGWMATTVTFSLLEYNPVTAMDCPYSGCIGLTTTTCLVAFNFDVVRSLSSEEVDILHLKVSKLGKQN